MISVAFLNHKPGTGKTTSAVWVAYALHNMGVPVLLVDADPAASTLGWSDSIAALSGERRGFPFPVVGLATRDAGRRIADFRKTPDTAVVVDCPQLEDHAAIGRSVMKYADEWVVTMAPTAAELDRTVKMRHEVDDMQEARPAPARVSLLLNRVVSAAASTRDYREELTEDGWDVLTTAVPRLELYAQSWGRPIRRTAGTAYHYVAEELIKRGQRGQ